jgi:hypothetical protein
MKALAKIIGIFILLFLVWGVVDGSSALSFGELIAGFIGLALTIL